jgi:hypothetical protein
MSNARSVLHCLTLAAGFCAGSSHADCVDTVGLSAAEQEFHRRAHAALLSFLPPAPVAEGLWARDDAGLDAASINVCRGDKKPGNFSVTVSRKYVWPDPQKRMADATVTAKFSLNLPAFKEDAGDGSFAGNYGIPSPQRSAGLGVHNVTWEVAGSGWGVKAQTDALRSSVAAAVDRQRLQGLVGRPLPPVAESRALAKKLPPTQLVAAPAADQAPAGSAAAPQAAPAAVPVAPPAGGLPVPTSGDNVKDAVETVQKLRGFFGR